MRKIIFYLFLISTACAFSFRKMEEFGVLKKGCPQKGIHTYVCGNDQTDEIFQSLRENLNSEKPDKYLAYLYDPLSKYLFTRSSIEWINQMPNKVPLFQAIENDFNLLKSITYPSIQEAKESFGISIKDQDLLELLMNEFNADKYSDFNEYLMVVFAPKLFLIDTYQAPDMAISIKPSIKGGYDIYGLDYILYRSYFNFSNKKINTYNWKKEFVSKSGVGVKNTVDGVKLNKINSEKNPIDFQEALGKYLENERRLVDNFSQPLIEFLNLKKDEPRDIILKLFKDHPLSKVFVEQKERFCLIEKHQELLKNSEILTIRYIIPNKDVTDLDNTKDPSKCTIIGTALDTRTNTTFHWVVDDLSENLEEIFES